MINKLKALYIKKGMTQKEMASLFDMSPASFNNKMRDCETRFDLKDIIVFADKCGLKVAFIDNDDNVVEKLSVGDLEK